MKPHQQVDWVGESSSSQHVESQLCLRSRIMVDEIVMKGKVLSCDSDCLDVLLFNITQFVILS